MISQTLQCEFLFSNKFKWKVCLDCLFWFFLCTILQLFPSQFLKGLEINFLGAGNYFLKWNFLNFWRFFNTGSNLIKNYLSVSKQFMLKILLLIFLVFSLQVQDLTVFARVLKTSNSSSNLMKKQRNLMSFF